jgi:hypothetical protein
MSTNRRGTIGQVGGVEIRALRCHEKEMILPYYARTYNFASQTMEILIKFVEKTVNINDT